MVVVVYLLPLPCPCPFLPPTATTVDTLTGTLGAILGHEDKGDTADEWIEVPYQLAYFCHLV